MIQVPIALLVLGGFIILIGGMFIGLNSAEKERDHKHCAPKYRIEKTDDNWYVVKKLDHSMSFGGYWIYQHGCTSLDDAKKYIAKQVLENIQLKPTVVAEYTNGRIA
ncbi:MAG TPA: hypothetical protein VM577_00200 [Anaerovoracaceae bacterium]|nr:hypothetical protein [Anaerovoracaceae bacterium]